jgi:hypothetical protein
MTRGILSGEMVRALLAGTKTQTRRTIKVNAKTVLSPAQRKIGFQFCPDPNLYRRDYPVKGMPRLLVPVRHPEDAAMPWQDCGCEAICPRWSVGDLLYVKETWRQGCSRHGSLCIVQYKADGKAYYQLNDNNGEGDAVGIGEICVDPWDDADIVRWRSAHTMPRWASRLTLEITDIRISRCGREFISAVAINHTCPQCKEGRQPSDRQAVRMIPQRRRAHLHEGR